MANDNSTVLKLFAGVTCAMAAAFGLTTMQANAGDRFHALSWSHIPAPTTANVGQLYELAPWTDVAALTASLNTQPEGRRWVIIYCLTEGMADHPSDRCIRREVRLVTRYVNASGPTSKTGTRNTASSRNTPGSSVPIMVRESTDVLTDFRGPWMENGISSVKQRVTSAMRKLVAAGAKVDGFVMSNETTLGAAFVVANPGTAAAISADPRWSSLSRQLGLPNDIRPINWGTDLYFRWTDVMAGRFDRALNEAVYEPIRAAFPNASVSNYNSGPIQGSFAWPDINGHVDRKTTAGFGTHDSHEFYGWLADGRVSKIKGCGDVTSAWMAFRLEIYKARGMISSSTRPRHAWIASRSWRGERWGPVAIANNALWDELMLHLGMCGFETLLEFSPDDPALSTSENAVRRSADRGHLDRTLAMLNNRAKQVSGEILTMAQPGWDDRVIATGRAVPNGTLWRFTFDRGVNSVLLQLSDGTSMRIMPDGDSQGCWLSLPAGRRLILNPTSNNPVMQVESTSEPAETPAVAQRVVLRQRR